MKIATRLVFSATLLLAGARFALAAWPNQATLNLPVCTAAGGQHSPTIVSDDAGGAFIAWDDGRTGTRTDIYAQRLVASGKVAPGWPAGGLAVCTAPGDRFGAKSVSDGVGGAILLWSDLRSGTHREIYAQHLLASGLVDPAWPANGRGLSLSSFDKYDLEVCPDGAGGVIVVWDEYRGATTTDIYAQHLLASGAQDPAWPAAGLAVCVAGLDQFVAKPVPDDAGGAVITWVDYRGTVGADLYAHHVLGSGIVDPAWPVGGQAICTNASVQLGPVLIGDGSHGAIIAWLDLRAGTSSRIYAQHIMASGLIDAYSLLNGNLVCASNQGQLSLVIVSDGAAGAILGWEDRRSFNHTVYAHHVLPGGSADPAWPADGRAMSALHRYEYTPVGLPDGSGGAIFAWYDGYSGGWDIFAQHVKASGALEATWTADGLPVSTARGNQQAPAMASDGSGGCILAWQDDRLSGGPEADIYAQRLARYGLLGTPEAEMAGVKDVPVDNGGKVRVAWTASYLEFDPYLTATDYYLFRSVPTHVAAQTIARNMRLREAGDASLSPGDLVSTPEGANTLYWEMVGTVPGMGVPGYSLVPATTGDSIGAGNPKTLFMVQTRNSYGFWNSPPDSGYSVDNIPPVTPAPFAANYAGGATHLHWSPNPDVDLANYRLYRDVSPSFTPSPATLLASPPDTGYADVAGATYTYKLTAMDVHGNESPVATITPAAIAGVDGGVTMHELALSPASPNPASRGTTLRFALPAGANVSLGVYDAAGRLVRALSGGALPAGEHAATWDLRDTGGHNVGAGLYFARLEVSGRTLVRRVAVTP